MRLTYPISGGEAELLERVARGEIDLVATDRVNYNMASNFHPELSIAMPLKIKSEIAWALPHNASKRFVDEINAFIARIRSNGLLARLADLHFGHVERLDDDDVTALLQRIQTRLPRYKSYFMEAEQLTGIDWRLIASIAYQESQWDPLATSYTGVRGMMMLTAETADRLRVSNRLDARESIKGGARYFSMLRDQLAREVPEPDRTWMAVAAYNLGMGHMNGARAIARRLGKDNTAWLPMKSVLPLMSRPAFAAQLKAGPARGGEAVIMTENVRNYFDIISRFEPPHRSSLGLANVDSEPGLKLQGASTSSPHVGLQHFGNQHGPVRLLIVFEHRDERAPDRKTRAVERVQQFVLALRVLEPRLHPARLERPGVGAGRDLPIGILGGEPDFEIVCLRRRETHVAGAKYDLAIWGASLRRIASACAHSSSSAVHEFSGVSMRTSSTFSNWCWRIMPRVSRP